MAKRKHETIVLMDYNSIAEATGLKPDVLRLWKSRDKMPAPDYMIAQSPGWLPATIEAWMETFGPDGRVPARRRG